MTTQDRAHEVRLPAKKPMSSRNEIWHGLAMNGCRLAWQPTGSAMFTLTIKLTGEADWRRAARLESIGERLHSFPPSTQGDSDVDEATNDAILQAQGS